MNTLSYFRNLEEGFQGDHKDGALRFDEPGAQLLWTTDVKFTQSQSIPITGMVADGLIYCFFTAMRGQLLIENGTLAWENESTALFSAIKEYYRENGKAFILVLDYNFFIPKLQAVLSEEPYRKFEPLVDMVSYDPISQMDRVEGFLRNNLRKMAFVKNNRYKYQQEMRVFIHARPTGSHPHADIYLGDLRPCLVFGGEYSPEDTKPQEDKPDADA